jgi:aryl-alcohol dehydrogenase-like predicted oxidoreductase
VALAWVRQQQGVTSPIFGATKPQHLADAVASVDRTLTDDELDRLAAQYITRAAEGF